MFKFNGSQRGRLAGVVTAWVEINPDVTTLEELKETLELLEFRTTASQTYLEDKFMFLQEDAIYKSQLDDAEPDSDDPNGVPPFWKEEFEFFGVTNKDYFKALQDEESRDFIQSAVYEVPAFLFSYLVDGAGDPKVEFVDDFFDTFVKIDVEDFDQVEDEEDELD